MRSKIASWFLFSAGMLFILTGGAKIISAMGHSRVLQSIDPLFGISFRQLLWIAGLIETLGALIILSKRLGTRVPFLFVAGLSTAFVVYRFGLFWLGYQGPCACLGTLTGALHVSPQTVDKAMKIVLAYLVTGSIATLLVDWNATKDAVAIGNNARTAYLPETSD
jgi:hypothetical protein